MHRFRNSTRVRPFAPIALAWAGLMAAAPLMAHAQEVKAAAREAAVVAAGPVWSDIELLGSSTAHALTAPLRWSAAEWATLPVALAGLGALSLLDGEGRTFMRSSQTPTRDRWVRQIERLGTVENFYVLVGFYASGLVFDDARARAVAAEGLASSLVAAGFITPVLQKIAGRNRPRKDEAPHTFDGFSGNLSFPSGHTTQAFAVASVIATEYESWWVKGAAYGLAGLVAAGRMYEDAHFISDVTAAALIGTVVGRSIVRHGQGRRGQLRAAPYIDATGLGAVLTLTF